MGVVSCSEGTAPVCCGKERAETEGEAFNLLVHLCFNPHLWSQHLGSDQKNSSRIQVAEMGFLQKVAGLSL